jgi:predicted NBD/HSP70 family sugar kinase
VSSSGGLSSAQQVLTFLLEQSEPVTRPQAALACELSRPTVFAAMARLVELGLVAEVGQRSGLPGRSASLYEVAAEAGLVVGIDIGGSNLRVALADVRGRVVAEDRRETSAHGGRAVLRQVVALVRRLGKGRLQNGEPAVVAVSVPGVVDADGATVHYAWNIGQPEPFDVRSPLAAALRGPVVLENNVNLAAIGEQWQGAARDLQTFAVVAVGAGVGAGIVHEGRLLRGAHGAAGEVAFLPLERGYQRMRAAAPDEAGGLILLRRAQDRKGWRGGSPPRSVADLFERAAAGEQLARELVEEESRRIAAIAAAVCAVVDPSTVILTGGVGSNEALARRTGELVRDLAPFPPVVVRSDLGERASLVGALALGVRTAQEALVRRAGDSGASQVPQSRP